MIMNVADVPSAPPHISGRKNRDNQKKREIRAGISARSYRIGGRKSPRHRKRLVAAEQASMAFVKPSPPAGKKHHGCDFIQAFTPHFPATAFESRRNRPAASPARSALSTL